MKTSVEKCDNCEAIKEFEHLGLVPSELISDDVQNVWVRVIMCTDCGRLERKGTSVNDIFKADDRYINALARNNIITEEEKEELLANEEELAR